MNSSKKHLPQTFGPFPGTAAKANPRLSHPSMVKGTWDKQVVDGPPSHLLTAFVSVIKLMLESHCLASFPDPAFEVQEQLGLQQSQYLVACPDPEYPPETYLSSGHEPERCSTVTSWFVVPHWSQQSHALVIKPIKLKR